MIFSIYILVAIIFWPNYVYSELQGNLCVNLVSSEDGVSLIIQSYSAICGFTAFYIIPCILFVFLYGKVILTFYKRQKKSNLATSRVIDKATSELTKTAIVVTLIFILTLGCNAWYILLGFTKAVNIVYNRPIHLISLWLASLNSVCNPFVYSCLMPAYRKSVQQTFFRCMDLKENDNNKPSI